MIFHNIVDFVFEIIVSSQQLFSRLALDFRIFLEIENVLFIIKNPGNRKKCFQKVTLKSKNKKYYEIITIFNFNNLFWIRVVGTSSRIQNKNEISINLFPVCYQSLSIILFCSRLIKSRTPQRFVLRHCLKLDYG